MPEIQFVITFGYIASIIAVIIFLLGLLRRFVIAFERIASSLENISRKSGTQ